MSTSSSIVGKLLAHACCAALGAFVFGLCLASTIKQFDGLYLVLTVLFGIPLIADLLWTRRQVRELAANETANEYATQFLWSSVFFSMLSSGFGVAVMAVILQSADFIRTFGAVWFGALTCVGTYPLVRDAKRLGDAVEPS